MNKAIFLDRDGVINVDHGYTHTTEMFEWIPGVKEACRELSSLGFKLIVVTNQSGIARRIYSEDQFLRLTEWMKQQFAIAGAPLLDVYYCPHHPTAGKDQYRKECQCRKPQPGMLFKAKHQHQLSLNDSWLVGDKTSDMQAAAAAGVPNRVLVESGKPITAEGRLLATAVLKDLTLLPKLLNQDQS